MTGIYRVYAWYMPGIFIIWIDWFIGAKKLMKLQSWVRTRMYRSLPRRGTWNHPSQCSFIQHEYLTGICQAYTKYIHVISLLLPSCGLSWSPKHAWMSRTWTSCGFFLFWLLKVLQPEAGACQSSTASRWSHRHGCPCAMQGPGHQHIRIRRPASVVQRTCME